jgi:CRISPR-associated endonuclease/helicase Cas3
MDYKKILAKNSKNPDSPEYGETLFGHTDKVVESFKIIFGKNKDAPTHLADKWLKFFKLDEKDFKSFHQNSLISCILHDIGKANSGFQDMVTRKGKQVIRHEYLSGLILAYKDAWKWLNRIPEIDIKIVISAVISHHLKSGIDSLGELKEPELKTFTLFQNILSEISDYFKLPNSGHNLEDMPEIWDFDTPSDFNSSKLKDGLKKFLFIFRKELKKKNSKKRRTMLAAIRSALIAADSAGSALVRENKNVTGWLEECFAKKPLNGDYIQERIIEPRIKEIEEKNGAQGKTKPFQWDDFQNAAGNLPEMSLLLSPCGSGKTLAAWRWIKARLSKNPAARVIFLYPTRATAAEGFRDYVSWAPEADASLISGTSKYELEDMFEQEDDERTEKDFTTEERMYALQYWQRRVFSATVDQFLGFMQQTYGSVCLLPLLADSVVVFDEIHSYDHSLFSALKLFLKNFNIPALCMTASLPPLRKDDLVKECGLTLFPSDLDKFKDLEKKADMPRYKVFRIQEEYEAEQIACNGFENNKRVLWVVNTVARSQTLAKKLNALCYHSRFKLDDRKEKHKEIVDLFQQKEKPVLAVTTQVCEMSLDLDADILISEAAPVTGMIQRMGRCNRHAKEEDNIKGQVYFYSPEDRFPYSEKDFEGSEGFIDELDNKEVSQTFLAEMLQKYAPVDIETEKYSAFLEDGPFAETRELRDEKDYTVSAIISEDISEYWKLRKEKKPIHGIILPVPKRFAEKHHKIGKFPLVAKGGDYEPEYGFLESPSAITF